MTEIDDDLQGLLKELDIGPEVSEDASPSPAPVTEVPKPQISPPIPIAPEPQDSAKVLPLVPILEDPDPPAEKEPTDLFSSEEPSQDGFDLQEFIIKHDRYYEEAQSNLRADRAKADELIRMLLDRVERGTASNQETEAVVQAVKCLVDSNGHMVRLLDSKTKLLVASKGSVNTLIQQNFGDSQSSSELEDMLTQNMDEDEV